MALLCGQPNAAFGDPPNRMPVADAGGAYTIVEGQALTLDGGRSYDPDGDTIAVSWDLNDDGVYGDAVGTNAVVAWATLRSLNVVSDGSWQDVWIRVTDGRGGTNETYTFLAIDNVAPTANAGGPYAIVEGTNLTLAGSAADAGGDALTATWDLADGSGTHTNASGTNAVVSWATLSALNRASDGSPLTIGLKVDDGDGGVTNVTATLSIANAAPVAHAGGPYTAVISNDLAIAGSATDPGNDTLTYAWDINGDGTYGDVTGATGTVLWADLETAGLSITNRIMIGLQVTDGQGGTNTTTTQVQLADIAPVADAGGAYAINEGQDLVLDGSASTDADGDALRACNEIT